MKKRTWVSLAAVLILLLNVLFSMGISVAADTVDGVYTASNETYTAMHQMETDKFFSQSFTMAVGGTDYTSTVDGTYNYVTAVKNTGKTSAMFTLPQKGTEFRLEIRNFSGSMTADTSYLQFWFNNSCTVPVYLYRVNVLHNSGYQGQLKSGVAALLIDDATRTVTRATWSTQTSLPAYQSQQAIEIPANFSGYIRLPMDVENFTKIGGSAELALASVVKIQMRMGVVEGDGGKVYIDDLGAVSGTALAAPGVFAKDIVHHINGFESTESFSAQLGNTYVSTAVKEAGNFAVTINEGTYYANPIISNTKEVAHGDSAEYLQFKVNNNSAVDQSIGFFDMSTDSSNSNRFRLTKNTVVYLIDDSTKIPQLAVWKNQRIEGLGTADYLQIPAGFSGAVRISLASDGLDVRNGSYSMDNIQKLRIFNFRTGNPTATAATITFDDFEFVDVIDELPAIAGAQIRTSDNNLRFVMKHNEAVMAALTAEYGTVEYGTVVVNASAFKGDKLVLTDKTTGFGSGTPTTLKNTSAFVPEGWEQDGHRVYSFVITSVNSDAKKATPIAVRAYIKVTDKTGKEHVLYSYDAYTHNGYQTTYNAVAAATAAVTGA